MPIVGQDDRFFLTDTGKRIAKSGLSQNKALQLQGLLPQPQMTPVPAQQTPMMSTVPAPTAAPLWEQPAAYSATSPTQLNMEPAQQVSTGPVGSVDTQVQPQANAGLNKMGLEIADDIRQGIGMQQAGIQKQLNAQTKMQQEVEKETIDLMRTQDQINYQVMRDMQERDARIAAAQTNLDTLRQNYADAEIDSDRFFGGSTGKRIMAGIAIAFGELGKALTGGSQNAALNIIQKAIDDDIAEQKENITNKQNQIALARQGLSDVKDLFKDKVDAQLAQKTLAIEAAQNKIKLIADRYGTQEAKAKGDMLIGQLEVSKAEAMGKLFDLASKNVQKAPLSDAQIKAVSDLSSAYEGNDGIKSFNKIDQAYKKMENLAKIAQTNPNAAQALITTFNRVLDENSVVREAEVNLTMQAGSVVDRFKQQAEKAISGKMTPEQTANLVEAAKELRNAALVGKQKLDQRFTERAAAFGVPSNLVISQQPLGSDNVNQLSSFTPRGQEPKQKTGTANVMPGR